MTTPSPCINVCQMDSDSGLCTGCLRTLDEIAEWSRLDDPARRRILAKVATRRREPVVPANAIAGKDQQG